MAPNGRPVRSLLKTCVHAAALLLALPLALLAGFGRIRPGFVFAAQLAALLPGLPGDYLRVAFYRLTLRACALDSRISFGTFFSHPDATVAPHVYIGAYCVIGRTRLGRHVHLASHVQILSGARQHVRDAAGNLSGAEAGEFRHVSIGDQSWIGAGAIVMDDVGSRTTIGAGAIVTRAVPDDVVAAGNPARILRAAGPNPPG